MGASESKSHSESDDQTYQGSGSSMLLPLYSREFPIDEDQLHAVPENLYLDNYGDEDEADQSSEQQQPEEQTPSTTPAPEEVDDYPLDKLTISMGTESSDEPIPESVESPQPASGSLEREYEAARQATQVDLDTRFPHMPNRTSACEEQRSSLLQCYKDSADVLNCRDRVSEYSQCAKQASSDVISVRS